MSGSFSAFFTKKPAAERSDQRRNLYEENSGAEAGPTGYRQLSIVYGGGGICAAIALGMMLAGAVGMKLVPAAYFGVVERFSVFAATGFNAALGLHLFCGDAAEA